LPGEKNIERIMVLCSKTEEIDVFRRGNQLYLINY